MEHPFADQCQQLAEAILVNNLGAINEDGTVMPTLDEVTGPQESGHAALAIGEFFRATGETRLEEHDLVDLSARTVTAQMLSEDESENGLAYAALGLLSFGPAKTRNPVWERLLDETKEVIDRRLLSRSDYDDHRQAFNIAKAVTRYSIGLSKKDETGKLIERFLDRIKEQSTAGFCDDDAKGHGGAFDIYGVLAFVFIRQSLQLHANLNLRERKLPSLRTFAEKYVKLLPDLVRSDGLGWCYGENIGAYGQMHLISLLLQSLRDEWVRPEQKPLYLDVLQRLFQYFFVTYIDQEQGNLVIRDEERNTISRHTTRIANFDAARYLSQWSRLARSIGGSLGEAKPSGTKTTGRFVVFNKSHRREQGLFLYHHADSGLHFQIPLVGNKGRGNSDSLAFPHSPGIFDWPVARYLPVMIPELVFGERRITPSYYGKNCVTGIGLRNSFYFRYEQPELITVGEEMVSGLGSCKVNWTFSGARLTSEYTFQVKQQVQMDSMRLVLPVGLPHSRYNLATSFRIGDEGLRPEVLKDDFHGEWLENEIVLQNPDYRTHHGHLHYLQTYARRHPMVMRPGTRYTLSFAFSPDIAFSGE